MNVKRYFAKTAREALRMLKEELGPDAVVLSNRAANGGVEILALPAGDVATLQAQRARAQAQSALPAVAPAPVAPAPAPKPAADFFDDDFRVSLSRASGARPPAVAPSQPASPPPAQARPAIPPLAPASPP